MSATLQDLARACFCGCCCLYDEKRTLSAAADCSCKRGLWTVIDDLEHATSRAIRAMVAIERWAAEPAPESKPPEVKP